MTPPFSLAGPRKPWIHLQPKPGSGPGLRAWWRRGRARSGGLTEPERRIKREGRTARCLLEPAKWPATALAIPATHRRSHHAEEVLHRSALTGSYSPALLKVESGGVRHPFREPSEQRSRFISSTVLPDEVPTGRLLSLENCGLFRGIWGVLMGNYLMIAHIYTAFKRLTQALLLTQLAKSTM